MRLFKLGLSALILTFSTVALASGQAAQARPAEKVYPSPTGNAFLFEGGPKQVFAPWRLAPSEQWNETYWYGALRKAANQGFKLLSNEFGHEAPSELRIMIKDRKMLTADSAKYVEALEKEKGNLMDLYNLSNREYNQLAVIAFAILGRETEFGTNFMYYVKERLQLGVTLKKAFDDWTLKPEKNSRGLTQIKTIPEGIEIMYCLKGPRDLRNPKVAAVATLGFLAESLQYMKHRARAQNLWYVNDSNIFDHTLYVYFGSLRQLTNPRYDALGRQVNEVATPEHNLYLLRVKEILKGLVVLESGRAPAITGQNIACRLRDS